MSLPTMSLSTLTQNWLPRHMHKSPSNLDAGVAILAASFRKLPSILNMRVDTTNFLIISSPLDVRHPT